MSATETIRGETATDIPKDEESNTGLPEIVDTTTEPLAGVNNSTETAVTEIAAIYEPI